MISSRLPLRMGAFGLVGLSGVGVNQLILWGLVERGHLNYLVAAIVASVGSTTSNFILTELWVFRSGVRRGVVRRYLAFAALTAASTPVRLPILFVLTSIVGIHYLVSNLVALGVLFACRYLVSSLFIWGGQAAYPYDIDGQLRVVSDTRLPELEFFRTLNEVDPDLIIRRGIVGGIRPRIARVVRADDHRLLWQEQTAGLGGNFQIDVGPPIRVTVAPLLALSPHVVYTNLVEPLLRFLLAHQGRMLLHAATIVIKGETITLSAKTDTGKTGTILRLLQTHGGEFLSDDMVILDPNGCLTRYPKPLTISAHTVRATPSHRLRAFSRLTLPMRSRLHSRQGRAAGKWLGQKNLPIMSMNAVVQALCPPPKYVVTELVDCQIGHVARLQHLFIIDRGERSEVSAVGLDAAAEALSINTDDAYGFPPYASLARALKIGGLRQRDLEQREREILASALQGLQPMRLVVDDYNWAAKVEQEVGLTTASLPDAVLGPAVAT